MKTKTLLLLIPFGFMLIGGIVALISPSSTIPEPLPPLMKWTDTPDKLNGDNLGKEFARKMEATVNIEQLRKAKEDEEFEERFDASPAGRKLNELERRVEEAERQANMAVGIAISHSNSTH